MNGHPRRPVLVGVDGTDSALAAARRAAAAAVLRRRPLHLIAAFPSIPDGTPPDASWPARSRARRSMIAAATEINLAYPGIDLDARIVPGRLADVLIDRSRQSDLVVVGRDASRYADGPTTADLVAGHAVSPVFVVGSDAAPSGGPVAVGVAGTCASPAVMDYAFGEAVLRGVALRVVYVWTGLPDTAFGTVDPFAYDHEAARTEAERVLAEVLAGWSDKYPDVEVERRVVNDVSVERGLVTATVDASVLVVARRSDPTLSEQLLGAVTRNLLRCARCPVVIIPTGRSEGMHV